MIQNITRRIFAHSFVNAPAEDRSSDVNLTVTNSKAHISLLKDASGAQTRYLLSVVDPVTLGLSSSEQNQVDMFVADLLLAANLSLEHAVLSTRGSEIFQANIQLGQPETKVTVRRTPEGQHVTLAEVAVLRETVHLTVGFAENIDEEAWVSKLGLIHRVDRRNLTTSSRFPLMNLRKSLNEYESAMSSFERHAIFKHLFNALEMAANWEKERSGNAFDNEVATTVGVLVGVVTDWRGFYDRTKHVDSTTNQFARFARGMQDLSQKLIPLRLASEAMLLDRLKRA